MLTCHYQFTTQQNRILYLKNVNLSLYQLQKFRLAVSDLGSNPDQIILHTIAFLFIIFLTVVKNSILRIHEPVKKSGRKGSNMYKVKSTLSIISASILEVFAAIGINILASGRSLT